MSSIRTPSTGSFILPVWIMGVLSVIRIFLLVTSILAIREMQLRHGAGLYRSTLLTGIILITVLTTKTVLYWVIRDRIYNRRWVWIHLVLMIFAIIVTPLLFIAYTWFLDHVYNTLNAGDAVNRAIQFRFYFFWMFFIGGSIFFIANCIKSFSLRNTAIEDEIDAIGSE